MPSTINADNGVVSGSAGLKSTADSSGVLSLQTNGTTAVTVDTSQNVGVGTSSPAQKLDVNGSIKSAGYFIGATGTTGFAALGTTGAATDGGNFVGRSATSTYNQAGAEIYTGGSERMRIDSSGNLLVGTTAAGGNAGCSILPNFSSGAATIIFDRATTTNTSTPLYFRNAGTIVGTITYTNTATAYNTSSDYRLKNITGPITNSGAYIDSLNPVEGTWKADGAPFVGLIAHEVQEVSRTQVATGEKDGAEMQGMDYSSAEIIANLIAEVKSLRARMAQLEAKG